MVSNTRWQCEDCEKIYNSRSDAIYCDCYAENRNPTMIKDEIKCEMCGKDCDTIDEVLICHEFHKKWDDHWYDEWKTNKGFKVLSDAARHHTQTHLDLKNKKLSWVKV